MLVRVCTNLPADPEVGYRRAYFEAHRYMGIKPNPLYSQAWPSRVHACINCRKDDSREIALRFPEAIDRIRNRWEKKSFNKRASAGCYLFAGLPTAKHRRLNRPICQALEIMEVASISAGVEWSKTTRGAFHYDLFTRMQTPALAAHLRAVRRKAARHLGLLQEAA